MQDRDIDVCSELMIADPVTLRDDATTGAAIEMLLGRHLHHLPVVDGQGRFVALFGASHITRLLMPRSLALGATDADVSFIHENLAEMRDRLREVLGRPVVDLAEHEVDVVHPDTPLMRGLQLLHRTRALVPVVARGDRRLLGVLAFRGVLERLRG